MILLKKRNILEVLQHQHFLFFSSKTVKLLLFVVLFSQASTIAISALDFSFYETYSFVKESEEPKPVEGKNAIDVLEESKFLVIDFPSFTFFSTHTADSFHKESFFFEVIKTLDSPPPELV